MKKFICVFTALLLLTSSSISVKAQSKTEEVANRALGIAALGWMLYKGITSHNSDKPLKQYIPGEDFPPTGYNLSNVAPYGLKECSINKFEDTDTAYYMKLILPSNKENTFYFMFLNKQTAEIILDNALNKERGSRKQRSTWFRDFLDHTNYDNLNMKGNDYWVYYKTKRVFTQNNPDAIEDGQVRGMGYLPFNYQRALDAIEEQKFRQNQWLYIGAVLTLMKSIGFCTPNGKYHYKGETFKTFDEMEIRRRQIED